MSKTRKPSRIQIDAYAIAAIVEADIAQRKADDEINEQIINQGHHDWRTEVLRALHKLKRAKPLIEYSAKGLDSIEINEYINYDGMIDITIITKWGQIEYALKASKQLKDIHKKVRAAEEDRRRYRKRKHSRPQIFASLIRDQLGRNDDQAAKARKRILGAVNELMNPQSAGAAR